MTQRYTQEHIHMIKQCIMDADIMGLTSEETIAYVKSRIGLDFSRTSYNRYRAEVFNDDSNVQWISYYARQGFVEFYRKRISEMEMIQKETFKQWLYETSKPKSQQDKSTIIKLIAELRANNQQLSSLGLVTPIIATIKNIIDKDKIDNATRFIRHPIQHKTSREDSDTSRDEAIDYGADTTTETESTTSRDLNRKF